MSSLILMCGALPSQILKMFSFMNMVAISRSTYHRHQSNYVVPAVVNEWTASQNQVLDELREIGGGLELSGDGRYDSPGHSAKYGGYTLMENRVNKVLDIQLVQV